MSKIGTLFRIKKVKNKISILSGICLLVTVLAIVSYSAAQIGDEALKEAKTRARNLANIEAGKIKTRMDHFLSIGRGLTQALAVNANPDIKLKLTREDADNIIQSFLINNSEIMGVIIGWEPNAFDGKDDQFKNTERYGTEGRYIPFWFIDEDGNFASDKLLSHTKLEKDQYGVSKSDYYEVPKHSLKEYIADPYIFKSIKAGNKLALAISPTSPIIYNGRFYGICGVDVHADFLQGIADNIEEFDRQAKMTLVGPKGILAGVTGQPGLKGKHISTVENNDWEEIKTKISQGKDYVSYGDTLKVVIPVYFGNSTYPWSVMIEVPSSVITAQVRSLLLKQCLVGLGLALLGILILRYIGGKIGNQISKTNTMFHNIAEGEGDLTKRLEVLSEDEIGSMSNWFNVFLDDLQRMITGLKKDVSDVSTSTSDFSATTREMERVIDEIAKGTENNATAMAQSSASINQVASSMLEINDKIKKIQNRAKETEEQAYLGQKSVIETGNSMKKIEESGAKIQSIINVITDIANQTNLLSLNAAIEAAKAGEAGKGFSVVAEEVRILAERSAKSVVEIRGLIDSSSSSIDEGLSVINSTAGVLDSIVEQVSEISSQINEMTGMVDEQQQGVNEVAYAVTEISKNSENNAVATNELSESTREITQTTLNIDQMIDHIHQEISRFRT